MNNLFLELILDSNVDLLYSVMAFTGAFIVLIILLSSLTNHQTNNNKSLTLIFSWVIFFCIQDGLWGMFASHAIKSDIGLTIASYIFHISAILSSFFWTLYFLKRVENQIKKDWIFKTISLVFTVIQFGMLIGNIFNNRFMFYVDENGLYTTTDYRKIMFYMQFIEYILIAIVFLFATIKYKNSNRRQFLAIFTVSASPILFSIFQMIYPDAPYDSLGFSVACLIIHSFLTIDYEKQVYKLNKLQNDLNDALVKTEAANKAKSTFLFNMSHDIRTPMNAIIGYTSLGKKYVDKPEVISDYLNKIDISSNQLLTLIDQVLEMARIESGKINLVDKETNLYELNNVLSVIFVEQAKSKDITFNIDSKNIKHPNVLVDANRLEQIINNVLSNAFKYTFEGGSVSYTIEELECAKNGYGLYAFTISDTGIGMSEEFIKSIYDDFARENTSTVSKIQGTGLGMSIVKHLSDLLDGTIDIESKKNVGTTISIKIPIRWNLKGQEINYNKQLQEIKLDGLKVLLVEDNELNREIATEILSDSKVIIDTANDGDIAVDKIKNAKPGQYDLILMDIQMPRMNGYDATRAIRNLENKELANIPIIAMTANAFEEDIKNAFDAGMNGHLAKPIDISKLLKTLSEYKK